MDMNPLELGSTGLKDQGRWEGMMRGRKAVLDAKNGDAGVDGGGGGGGGGVGGGGGEEFDSSIMAEVSIMDVSEDEP